jgi:2-succinyl-5-enolpyruvyl-6-hydroxy-3-cyclohexene-1-carboxylate synthase
VQLAFDPGGDWHDPDAALDFMLQADPLATLAEWTAALATPAAGPLLERWRAADKVAAAAIELTLGDELSEPRVARELGAVLPAQATLVVASSMPVRDVETFVAVRADPPRVLASRGANGIDGTVATALGVAAAGEGPVVLLIGDVALVHDAGSLLALRRLALSLKVVLLDNDGGGIFDFLPVGTAPAVASIYERHVLTPTGADFAALAAAAGIDYRPVTDRPDLRRALGEPGSALLHIRGERAANVALHRRTWDAVAAALGGERRASAATPTG